MTDQNPIRVMLVDDHTVVRSGLSAFLWAYDDLELVGEASSGERAVQLCEQYQPDVVLMDLIMPGIDGATATGLIREKCPQIQVIALTSFKEQELVEGALKAGAIGYPAPGLPHGGDSYQETGTYPGGESLHQQCRAVAPYGDLPRGAR